MSKLESVLTEEDRYDLMSMSPRDCVIATERLVREKLHDLIVGKVGELNAERCPDLSEHEFWPCGHQKLGVPEVHECNK